MTRRLLVGAAVVAALSAAGVVGFLLLRGPTHPRHADALDLCVERMPAQIRGTVSDVTGSVDGRTRTLRGRVGGDEPGEWTCRVTLGRGGAMLYLDSLVIPGQAPIGTEHER